MSFSQKKGRLKIIYPTLLAPFALRGLLPGLCFGFPAIRMSGRVGNYACAAFGRRGYCFLITAVRMAMAGSPCRC